MVGDILPVTHVGFTSKKDVSSLAGAARGRGAKTTDQITVVFWFVFSRGQKTKAPQASGLGASKNNIGMPPSSPNGLETDILAQVIDGYWRCSGDILPALNSDEF